ncbi:glutathione S-transferase family protein [Pyruvatibacter mobilis]|uniref:glutathione S-transferase family protein n=1 Tax=Pyruvatibacter mobilis TaxID=1712261 RepID=UPI003BA99E2D
MRTNTLYGGPISLYTGKARAYLDWKQVPYTEVLSTAEVYKEIILPRVGWPVIPVVVTADDETLQDTTEIIDHFEADEPEPSVYPAGPAQKLAALLLEVFGDEWMKIPAMHYRWNYNEDWILTQFGALSAPDASPEDQREIGEKRAGPFRGALPFLGVHPETRGAVEESYEALLAELSAHFEAHEFLFGSRPSIGDYGLIGPLYAHNYRDPKSGEMMKATAPRVARWVERMVTPPTPRGGDFLPDDAVPDTLIPLLACFAVEYLPVLEKTVSAFNAWSQDQAPGTEIPRALGMHEFTLGGVTAERAIFTFDLWMLQRPLDFYRGLEGDAKAAADRLLARAGLGGIVALPDYPRITRKNFKTVLA